MIKIGGLELQSNRGLASMPRLRSCGFFLLLVGCRRSRSSAHVLVIAAHSTQHAMKHHMCHLQLQHDTVQGRRQAREGGGNALATTCTMHSCTAASLQLRAALIKHLAPYAMV
jgi:hypothetical protein